ncbi:hypothetical protein QTP70_020588, partial [Hemibagrus guttatus]
VCLEHAFHLLLDGHILKAKQQLSVATSWRYGRQSASQSLELKLIHGYCGFLDYLAWSQKRSSVSDTGERRRGEEERVEEERGEEVRGEEERTRGERRSLLFSSLLFSSLLFSSSPLHLFTSSPLHLFSSSPLLSPLHLFFSPLSSSLLLLFSSSPLLLSSLLFSSLLFSSSPLLLSSLLFSSPPLLLSSSPLSSSPLSSSSVLSPLHLFFSPLLLSPLLFTSPLSSSLLSSSPLSSSLHLSSLLFSSLLFSSSPLSSSPLLFSSSPLHLFTSPLLFSSQDCVNNRELHTYFRQASVTLQELIKQPGVWDPFVLGCVDMFEFYSAEEEVLQLLQNYANNKDYPSNPNAHVYLYKHQKRHKASTDQLLHTLKGLHSLVPSHELMLEYCALLVKSGEQKDLQHALSVAMNLLEYTSWKTDMKAWTCLLDVLKCLKNKRLKTLIIEEQKGRRELWMKMHFKAFHNRKDSKESAALVHVKTKAAKLLGMYSRRYKTVYSPEEEKLIEEEKSKKTKNKKKT